jgi:hypothetical protein
MLNGISDGIRGRTDGLLVYGGGTLVVSSYRKDEFT